MGNYIKILAVAIVVSVTGCKDWLDVTPAGTAVETDLFSSGAGYRTVLNGLYKSMGQRELYGRNWSYGMLDCMAQMYILEGETATFGDEMCKAAARFEYTNYQVSSDIEQAWATAYNIIANANDLIQNIENAPNDIFADGEMERKMIMGEAYACRALMHFELLRLFAPALVKDDGRTYLPYVESYPILFATKIGVKPFLEKVIMDLEKGRELVAVFDTTFVGHAMNTYAKGRFDNDFIDVTQQFTKDIFNIELVDDFFKGRGYRLSYNAITALLARVCQYAGRDEDAFNYAEEVLSASPVFAPAKKMYEDNYQELMNDDVSGRADYKTKSNLIFAAYNSLAYQGTGAWLETDWTKSAFWGYQNLFQISEDYFSHGGVDEKTSDYRWRYMTFQAIANCYVSSKWYIPSADLKNDNTLKLFPVIRLTEMKYIVAEYHARHNNWEEAFNVLNDIRKNRGITTSSLSGTTWEEFKQELLHDARREWISEGQLFFLYKRLDAEIVRDKGELRPMTLQESMFPVPADIK